ncbi:MAG: helix-turn-helix domain-containing protein, partial [Halobacteria archaeon]|nr:helix-turn-helix domain-containing protein [Halobacteria archaeon]
SVPDELSVKIHQVGEYTPEGEGILSVLTNRQREVLETAVQEGYYSVPRESSHEDIANALGCAPSTASEHLRKIESRIMSRLITRS